MSHTVQIDYQGIAIKCHSICEVAEKQLAELDAMIAKAESTSSRLINEQSTQFVQSIYCERKKLEKQIKTVRESAEAKAKRGVVSVDNEREEFRHSRDDIAAAENLQHTIDELASKRLIEFQSLLQTLLGESIQEHQRKMREQNNGVVTIDSRTQTLLDGIGDEVLRQFTYLAYLSDNTLVGDKLLQAGQTLMEQMVNQTYEERYEVERAKIRAELEASRIAPETINKVIDEVQGSAQEKLTSIRQNATAEIVGEKVRQKSLKIIMDAIKQRGFVVDKKNIKIKRDTNEVIMVALKASGEKAEFRIFLDGKFIYDFHGYEGQACQKDIEPFMHDLEEVYGIKVTKQTEIWSNPDKISTMKYQAMNTNKNKQ
jgi:hypothetical protein